jgi:hypothetical protein
MNALATRLPEAGAAAEALIREARRRQHRRWLAIGAALATGAGATAAVIAGAGGGGGPRPPVAHRPAAAAARPPVLAHAYPPQLVPVSRTRLPKGNTLGLATGYRAVWVAGMGVTYQINEVTGRIVRTISTPGTRIGCPGPASGIAAGAGAVWVTHGRQGIYRIDPYRGRVTASLRVPGAGGAITVADGLVWVLGDHGLVRIQPRTGQVTGPPIRVAGGAYAIIPGLGALWVTSNDTIPDTVYRIDPATGVVRRFDYPAVSDVGAVGAGSLWSSLVQRVGPAGRLIAATPVGASQVAFWHGSAWALAVAQSLTFLRIDPATNQVTGPPVPFGKPLPGTDSWPTATAAGPTGLWVLDYSRNLLYHLAMRPARP